MFGRKMRSGDYLPYPREGSYPFVAPRPVRYGSYPVVYSDQYPFMAEDPAYSMDYPSGYYGSPYSMESRRRYHPPFVSAAPANSRGRAPWDDPALDGAYYPRERGMEYLPDHEFVYPLRRFPSVKASKIPAEEVAFRSPYYPAHPEAQSRNASPQFVPLEDVIRDALQNQGKAQSTEKHSSPGQYVLLDDALRKALQYPQPARGTEDGVSGERFDRPVILVPSNYLRNAEDAKVLPPKSDPAPLADHPSPEGSRAYVPLKIPLSFSPNKEENVANSHSQAEPIYILGPDSLIPVHSNSSHGKLDGKAEGMSPELGYPIAYIPASSVSNSLNDKNCKESKFSASPKADISQPKSSIRLIPVTQQADALKPVYLHVGRHADADSDAKDADRNTRSTNKDQRKNAPPVEGQPDEPKQLRPVQAKKEKLQEKQEQSRPKKIFNPETAATLIQSFYRGYVVRKSEPLKYLREIAKVRSKSKDLQAQVCKQEDLERICSNSKERLKLTEGIMALLLQLDVIQGVHPVVREFRKSAARELIQLQERVDNAIKQLNKQQGSLTAKVEDVTTVDHQTVSTCTVEKIAGENEAGDVEIIDQSIPAKVDTETFMDDNRSWVVLKDFEKVPTSDEIVEKIAEKDNPIPNAGEDEEKGLKITVAPGEFKGLECSEACKDADNQPTNEETMIRAELPEGVQTLIEERTADISNDDDNIDHSLSNEANISENVKEVLLHLPNHQAEVPPEQSTLETYNVAEEQEKSDCEVILQTQSPSKEAMNVSDDGLSHQLAAEQRKSELVIADDEGAMGITETDMVDGGDGPSQISVAEAVFQNMTNSVIASEMKDSEHPVKYSNAHESGQSSSEEMVQNAVGAIEAEDHVGVTDQRSDSCGSSSTEDEQDMKSTGGTTTQIESNDVCSNSAAKHSDKHDGMCPCLCQSEACSVAKDWESSESVSNEAMSLSAAMEDSDICVAEVHEILENNRNESTREVSSVEQDLSKLNMSTVDMQAERIKTEISFCVLGKPQLPDDEDSKIPNAEEGEKDLSVDTDKERQDENLDKPCDNLTAIAKDCLEEVDEGSQAEGFQGKGSKIKNFSSKLLDINDDEYAYGTLPGLDCKCNIADEDVKNICYSDNRVNDGISEVEQEQPNLLTSPADSDQFRNSTVEAKVDDTTNVHRFEANVSQDANPNKSESSGLQLMQVLSEENKMLKSLVNELMHCGKIQALSILHLQERLVRLENSLSQRKPQKSKSKSKGKVSTKGK